MSSRLLIHEFLSYEGDPQLVYDDAGRRVWRDPYGQALEPTKEQVMLLKSVVAPYHPGIIDGITKAAQHDVSVVIPADSPALNPQLFLPYHVLIPPIEKDTYSYIVWRGNSHWLRCTTRPDEIFDPSNPNRKNKGTGSTEFQEIKPFDYTDLDTTGHLANLGDSPMEVDGVSVLFDDLRFATQEFGGLSDHSTTTLVGISRLNDGSIGIVMRYATPKYVLSAVIDPINEQNVMAGLPPHLLMDTFIDVRGLQVISPLMKNKVDFSRLSEADLMLKHSDRQVLLPFIWDHNSERVLGHVGFARQKILALLLPIKSLDSNVYIPGEIINTDHIPTGPGLDKYQLASSRRATIVCTVLINATSLGPLLQNISRKTKTIPAVIVALDLNKPIY